MIVDYAFWISYHVWRKEFKSRFFISPAGSSDTFRKCSHYHWYLIFVGKGFPKIADSLPLLIPWKGPFS